MTRHAEWQTDRANFLRLIQDQDVTGDVPVAIRVDITPAQAAVMAPGVTDWEELRFACTRFVANWVAPEMKRMYDHLEWKASQ